jgi:septin family protein
MVIIIIIYWTNQITHPNINHFFFISFHEIVAYLEKQYDDILAEESRIKRNPRFRDNRVHALLYFIAPTGHALREIDIELMRRLSPRVNVIPVVGRADSLTPQELRDFKKRVSCLVCVCVYIDVYINEIDRLWKMLNITIFLFITSLMMLKRMMKIQSKKIAN